METASQNKNERINLRLKGSTKRILERAAAFEGKTVSSFILSSALERAEKAVQEHEMMSLNAENSKAFFDALAAPVCFNRNLSASLEEHGRRVASK